MIGGNFIAANRGNQRPFERGLGLETIAAFAERARVVRRTIVNLENDKHAGNSHTLASVRRAFEAAGITFQNGGLARIKIG
jgi:DNA-binding XRE family transcriptional regulator